MTDWELILVDDASTDNSLSILRGYEQTDKRIHIITYNENKGPMYAREQGCKLSQGEFVTFCDGDDELSENALEVLVKSAVKEKADIVIGQFETVFSDGRREPYSINAKLNYGNSRESLFKSVLMKEIPQGVAGKMFHKDIVKTQGLVIYENCTISEDAAVLFQYIDKCQRACVVSDTTYYYNQRNSSTTHSCLTNVQIECVCKTTVLRLKVLNKYPTLKREINNYFTGNLIYLSLRENEGNVRGLLKKYDLIHFVSYQNVFKFNSFLDAVKIIIKRDFKPVAYFFNCIKMLTKINVTKMTKERILNALAARLMLCGTWLPDVFYLRLLFRLKMGFWPNLNNPETFSEKLQWIKIHDRRPEYTTMVDKYAVKQYVADIIGEKYIIPTIAIWNNVEQIDWNSLPKKFVLKTTHGGGSCGVVICRDKDTFDKHVAVEQLIHSLKQDIYRSYREWPYKNVPKRIIAEKYMEDCQGGDLLDYKFFCFRGEPKYCQVIGGRDTMMTIDFYDMKWQHQSFHEPRDYPFSKNLHNKPKNFEEMKLLATKLAKDYPFLRVDFYDINGRVFFGELTFFPTSGMGGFDPKEWDYVLGKYILLNCSN